MSKRGLRGQATAAGDVEGCFVLVEVPGGNVQGPCSFARVGSLAKGLGDSIGRVLPVYLASDAAVGAKRQDIEIPEGEWVRTGRYGT